MSVSAASGPAVSATVRQTDSVAAGDLVHRVQRLTAELDSLSDPAARNIARDFMRSIMELYGAGLAKVVQVLSDAGDAAAPVRQELINDGVFASLLLIHDLYPVPLETRVQEALESVRPYLESHGGNVTIISVEDGVARLRLEGSCKGCPASTSTLELAIKKALEEAAPDLAGLQVEGVVESAPSPGTKKMLPLVGTAIQTARQNRESEWFAVTGVSQLGSGEMAIASVSGVNLLVAKVDDSVLAYMDHCAGCHSSLRGGHLSEGVLTCPACDRRFFLPLAGRSLDEEQIHLEPVPLLGDQGVGVKVALAV